MTIVTTASRPAPAHGPEHYKTWQMAAPLSTHHRKATCEEVDCSQYLNGFAVPLQLHTEDGQRNLALLRGIYGQRRLVPHEGGITLFVLEPGTPCLKRNEHRIRLDRPPLYIVRDGDWRGNPRRTNPQVLQGPDNGAEQWIETYSTHRDKVYEA